MFFPLLRKFCFPSPCLTQVLSVLFLWLPFHTISTLVWSLIEVAHKDHIHFAFRCFLKKEISERGGKDKEKDPSFSFEEEPSYINLSYNDMYLLWPWRWMTNHAPRWCGCIQCWRGTRERIKFPLTVVCRGSPNGEFSGKEKTKHLKAG